MEQAQAKAEGAEELVAALESREAAPKSCSVKIEGIRQQIQQSLTAAKVALAQVEERKTSYRAATANYLPTLTSAAKSASKPRSIANQRSHAS